MLLPCGALPTRRTTSPASGPEGVLKVNSIRAPSGCTARTSQTRRRRRPQASLTGRLVRVTPTTLAAAARPGNSARAVPRSQPNPACTATPTSAVHAARTIKNPASDSGSLSTPTVAHAATNRATPAGTTTAPTPTQRPPARSTAPELDLPGARPGLVRPLRPGHPPRLERTARPLVRRGGEGPRVPPDDGGSDTQHAAGRR